MNKCSDFHIFFLWKNFVFPVALLILLPSDILKFVCLSVWILVWAIKKSENWSNITKFGYKIHVNNLFLHVKNCDHMFGYFLQGQIKNVFWIFVQPLLLDESFDFHFFFFFYRCRFYDDIIDNSVAVRQFNVCLFVYLNVDKLSQNL